MAHELAIGPAELPLAVPRPVPGTAPSRRPVLPVAGESAVADPEAVQAAAGNFLPALGIGPGREEPRETPARMARAYAEFPGVQSSRLTAFPNRKGHDDLVLARDIPFQTVCAHHLLPLAGVAHVGYLPAGRFLGLSTLARLVEHFAARAPTQERLTAHVAGSARHAPEPARRRGGAGGRALLHSLRGVRAPCAKTVTSALLETLREDPRSRAEFLTLTCTPSWLTLLTQGKDTR
jgi:GTP cyclohydrolase I